MFYLFSFLLCLLVRIELVFADKQAIVEALNISHDKSKKVLTAQGEVMVTYDSNKLFADEISYDLDSHLIKASGNIRLENSKKDLIQAEKIEIDDKLLNGKIKNIKMDLSDNNFIEAKEATKEGENYQLSKAFYTSCGKLCGPSTEWRVYAEKAIYNKTKNKMIYKNGILYAKKFPVIYVPYLSHPVSSKIAVSGLLVPKFKSYNGGTLILPIYLSLGQDKEIIYKPKISPKENIIHNLQYNQLFEKADLSIDLDFIKPRKTDPSTNSSDYFITQKWGYEPTKNVKLGSEIESTSNVNYQNLYNFGDDKDFLSQNIYAVFHKKSDYVNINYVSFENLADINEQAVAPSDFRSLDSHKEFNIGKYGNYILSINYLNSHKSNNRGRNRAIITGQWLKNIISDNGNIFDISYKLRKDYYSFGKNNSFIVNSPTYKSKTVERNINELYSKWRLPLMKKLSNPGKFIIIEPMAKIFLSFGKYKNDLISNEDSSYDELSHANLFSDIQFQGLDRIEEFSKITYGVNSIVSMEKSKYDLMFGQIFYFNKPKTLIQNETLSNNSDLLLKANYNFDNKFNFSCKTKFDTKSLKNNFIESKIDLKIKKLDIYHNYGLFKRKTSGKVKFHKIGISKNFLGDWSLYGETSFSSSSKLTNDVNNPKIKDTKMIYYKIGSKYNSNCSQVKLSITRDFTRNFERQRKPGIVFTFQVKLRNLN